MPLLTNVPPRRPIAGRLVEAALLTAFLVGCQEHALAPLTPELPSLSTKTAYAANTGDIPLWGPGGVVTPYPCSTRIAEQYRDGEYREARIFLHYSPRLIAQAGGETRAYQLRRFRADGYLIREATCVIPASWEAYNMANERFGLPRDVGRTLAREPEGWLHCGMPGQEPCQAAEILLPGGCGRGMIRGDRGTCVTRTPQ